MSEPDYIDIYCERTGPEFWSEPVNALTNLSFIIAAITIMAQIRKQGLFHVHFVVLATLIAAIGTGSFLFHTKAVFWALLSDVIPILLFQLYYLFVYSRWVLKTDFLKSFLWPVALIILIGLNGVLFPGDLLNGSIGYAPSLIVLAVVTALHLKKREPGGKFFLSACALFILSLTFRTIDEALCPYIPTGTHYLWHVINGLVLFLLVQSLVLYRKQK